MCVSVKQAALGGGTTQIGCGVRVRDVSESIGEF